MHIIEIYKSLQGESSFAGLPCIFVRLAGCNLRCTWCDSEYTFTGGRKMSEQEILAEVQRLSPSGGLVEVTGGEPMLQARELVPFLHQLLALDVESSAKSSGKSSYQVLLETSGERPLELVPRAVHKIVDVKCPGSGEHLRFRLENLATLTARDELKFVLASRQDYEYARDFIRRHNLEPNPSGHTPAESKAADSSPAESNHAESNHAESNHAESNHAESKPGLILSPAFRKDAITTRSAENCLLDPRSLADWMLADNLQARLGLQLHKFIWEPQLKGV